MTQSAVNEDPGKYLPGMRTHNQEGIVVCTGKAVSAIPFGRFVVIDATDNSSVDLPEVGEVATLGLGFAEEDRTMEQDGSAATSYPVGCALSVMTNGPLAVESTTAVLRGEVVQIIEGGADAGKVANAGGVAVNGVTFAAAGGPGLVPVQINLPNRA